MEQFRADLTDVGNALVDTLGKSLGVDLTLDAEGTAFFDHEDGWHIGLMLAGSDQLVAAVALVSDHFPTTNKLAKVLTDFNWMGAQTAGAALGYNPERGSFVLWRSVGVTAVTAEDVNDILLQLVAHAPNVRRALREELGHAQAEVPLQSVPATFGARV